MKKLLVIVFMIGFIVACGDKNAHTTMTIQDIKADLPIVFINTEKEKDITSRTIYQRAILKFENDSSVFEDTVFIKGRGNSSWRKPKKSYRLKLKRKAALLNYDKDKSWVLISNYKDKTMLRNHIAFYMSSISNLEYTPKSQFVELVLNNQYYGTYQLCERIKIDKHRINISKDGYLLEIDGKAKKGETTFRVEHLRHPVNIKEPSYISNNKLKYIIDYFRELDYILYTPENQTTFEQWEKYIDVDSFVDWYLINEIAKNVDANFHTSCFMYLEPGGKLKMGPVWDFDRAFGNNPRKDLDKPNGFHVRRNTWFDQLFHSPLFVAKIKERFNYFYNHKADIMLEINTQANQLNKAICNNEKKWHILYTDEMPDDATLKQYNKEVKWMKKWLDKRFEWLRAEFNKL